MNPFKWEYSFPTVYGHTSVSFLKQCPGYIEAKQGSLDAALSVAGSCVKQERIRELKEKYPDAILTPVITKNKLPVALAKTIGLTINTNLHKISAQNRKTLCAAERLIHKPSFSGSVKKGKKYIIVDDIITQGGTVSEMRKSIIESGGKVIAVSALAFSADSKTIAPRLQDITEIKNKFDYRLLIDILKKNNITDDITELTHSQIRYLLRFGGLEELNKRIAKIHEL